MEKKRFKMYKKGKSWLVAPIVFFSILGAAAVTDTNLAHADEVKQDLVTEQTDISSDTSINTGNSDQSHYPGTEESTGSQTPADTTDSESIGESTGQEQGSTESEEKSTESNESNSSEETVESTDTIENETEKPDESESVDSAENQVVDSNSEEEITKQEEEKETVSSTEKTPEKNATTQKDSSMSSTTNVSPKVEVKAASTATTKAAATVTIAIYRVYNPNSGEHLHTMNSNEKDYLVRLGWRYEGISMYVTNSGRQLYRVYNPNSGEHFYTLNANERDNLKKHGWRYEGIAWLTPWSGLPMYRVYNPNTRGAGAHHYTMLASERDSLIRAGWRNEGISWYSLASGNPIQLNFLGVNSQYIINELSKHVGDKYYLGTPYVGLSVNDASKYMKPGVSMNCTGFVAKVIQNAGGNLSQITNKSNNWGGLANAYNWRNALNQSVTAYSFNSVADLLKSGKASKGDIIYFEPNYSVTNYDCHIGFFWGSSSSDNKMWHSVPSTNRISSIYAPTGYSKVVVYKM